MSQQGPGGYGGGGPYGPPGGGYPPGAPPGAPPGGYGGPGYGPPGYPQQPGYGPGAPMPQPAPPAKKSNALLFVGLGCGVLVLLGIGGALWAYFGVYKPAAEKVEALQTAATTVVPGLVSAVNPGGTASPICAKAAACCRAILERTPARNATGNCDAFSLLNDQLCEKQYDAFKRQASAVGATCD